jgi:hypothetical protein
VAVHILIMTMCMHPMLLCIFQVAVDWIDYKTMCLRRQLPCGKDLSYKLVAGPAGFAQALVGTEFEETEVANLLLAVQKRPAAAAQKNPAAAQKEESEDDPEYTGAVLEAEAAVPAAVEVERADGEETEEAAKPSLKTYQKLWYKNSFSFGVRQKFGAKSQIFGVGGKRCTMSKEELGAVADEAIVSMEAGRMSEDEASKAAKARVL